MGVWGTEPWEGDAAADWFHNFFDGIDVDARIDEAFMEYADNQEQIRAACYLLGALGRIYVWPGEPDRLGDLLDRGMALLTRMLQPDEDDDYISQWDEELRAPLRASIQQQIDQLRTRRAEVL